MKKILLTVAGLVMLAAGANAQAWGFGPKVGVNFSTINGLEGAKTRTGVTAGVFFDRMINNWFSIQTEVLYSMNGFRMENEGVTTKVNMDYIKMPIITKYYLVSGLNLELGAQFGYLVKSKTTNDTFTGNLDAMVNKYNVDLVAGVAYDFDFGLILEGRYNIGLNKAFNSTGNEALTNGTLQFIAGWRF